MSGVLICWSGWRVGQQTDDMLGSTGRLDGRACRMVGRATVGLLCRVVGRVNDTGWRVGRSGVACRVVGLVNVSVDRLCREVGRSGG